jgi:hypothetical protein
MNKYKIYCFLYIIYIFKFKELKKDCEENNNIDNNNNFKKNEDAELINNIIKNLNKNNLDLSKNSTSENLNSQNEYSKNLTIKNKSSENNNIDNKIDVNTLFKNFIENKNKLKNIIYPEYFYEKIYIKENINEQYSFLRKRLCVKLYSALKLALPECDEKQLKKNVIFLEFLARKKDSSF